MSDDTGAMTPEHWQRVSSLLADALELAPAERPAFLAALEPTLRAEVQTLIASHEQAGSALERPVAAGWQAWAVDFESGEGYGDPERIGPYRVERLLGRGGMGAVFLALRDDDEYEKRVAIKVLRAGVGGPELVGRFRRERQILANLQHPHIAQLLDGGTLEDGRPYLVMEYVAGRPIDCYCAEEEVSLEDRLALFRKVCGAVHSAHQNLIVHRDLKPANILVGDDGEPKLLDFGIAKLLEEGAGQTWAATRVGVSPMTLSHASPEQVRGETITTASDVYALGVVLYELIADRLPYKAAETDLRAMAEAICQEPPPLPSRVVAGRGPSWRRRLSGDLDTIVLHALHKEPERRYASAEQLAEDLEGFSKGLPVRARPDSLRYRAGKFVRRHRLAVAAAVLVALMVVAFTVSLWVQRQEIERKQRKAEEVARVMIDLFDSADPDRALGERLTARQLLDRGARQIESRLRDEPDVRADLLATFGEVYHKLGLHEEALPFLEEALQLRRDLFGEEEPVVAETLLLRARAHRLADDLDAAEAGFTEALKLFGDQPARSGALQGLALVHQGRGDLAAAEEHFAAAEESAEAGFGADSVELARVLNERGSLDRERGDLEAALTRFERALAIYRGAYGARHPEVAGSLQNVALVLNDLQRFAEAEELYESALAFQRELYDGSHPSLATTLDNLASSLYDQGRFAEALPLAEEALDIKRLFYGKAHGRVARSLNLLGLIHAQAGETARAEEYYRRAIATWRAVHGGDHHDVAGGLANLAELLAQDDRLEEARVLLEEAVEMTRGVYGADHAQTAILTTSLGAVMRRQGDLEGAEALYRQALPVLVERLGRDHVRVATLHHNLGVVLEERDELEASAEEFEMAMAGFRAVHGDVHYYVGLSLRNLARVRLAQNRPAEGEALVREALEVYSKTLPEDHPWVEAARRVLAASLAEPRE